MYSGRPRGSLVPAGSLAVVVIYAVLGIGSVQGAGPSTTGGSPSAQVVELDKPDQEFSLACGKRIFLDLSKCWPLTVTSVADERICLSEEQPVFADEAPASVAADQLKPLEALGGKSVTRSITYQWMYDRKFLRARSERRVGDDSVEMTIMYLWDPLARKIKAWVISSDGSWSQAEVEIEGGTVRLNSKGASPDGRPLTLTSTLQSTGEGTRTESL